MLDTELRLAVVGPDELSCQYVPSWVDEMDAYLVCTAEARPSWLDDDAVETDGAL